MLFLRGAGKIVELEGRGAEAELEGLARQPKEGKLSH